MRKSSAGERHGEEVRSRVAEVAEAIIWADCTLRAAHRLLSLGPDHPALPTSSRYNILQLIEAMCRGLETGERGEAERWLGWLSGG